MATDGFLVSYLSADDIYEMESFKKTILRHLVSYYKYNKYDGVYLIIKKNMALYTQDGFAEILKSEQRTNFWYDYTFSQLNDFDFAISVDKSLSDKKEIALFINYKIKDWYGNILGVIGVYTNIFKFVSKIRDIEYQSKIIVKFIDEKGNVKISNNNNKSKIGKYNLSDTDEMFKEYFSALKLNYQKTKNDTIQYED
ncbi:MAG: hypothetical protein K6F46_04125, partial [Desulfovibrio sp.]|nr:hypothetical protein [Desulfovibrio sp.]